MARSSVSGGCSGRFVGIELAGRLQPSKNLADAGLADVEVTGKLGLVLELAAVEKGLIMTGEGERVAFGLRLGGRAGGDVLNGGPGEAVDDLGSST
jgi:hypothetical protein